MKKGLFGSAECYWNIRADENGEVSNGWAAGRSLVVLIRELSVACIMAISPM